MSLLFEWDKEKAQANLRKHKISFEEAKTVFSDSFLMTFPDPEHSHREQRYLNIGYSLKQRILIVVHTEREVNVRISSCRKATRSERRNYEKGNL
ncbi:MAG: BrnT family toxin [Chloroflexota bacterium]|nr:BrnT family toxin [Chloroflexota bacterium]